MCYVLHVCCLLYPFFCTGTAVWPLLQFSSCNILLCVCMLRVHFCPQAQGFGHFFNFTSVFYNLGIFDPWASHTGVPVHKSGSDASRSHFGPSLTGLFPKVAISLKECSNRSQCLLTGTAIEKSTTAPVHENRV